MTDLAPASPAPILVVSLATATARRAALSERLSALGLEARFVDAIDARTAPPEAYRDAVAEEGPWGWVPPGDAACTASHRVAWARLLDTGAPAGLILEDDVLLADAVAEVVADLAWWPEGCGIVKLERWASPRLVVALGRARPGPAGTALHPLLSRHPGAAAYLIARDTARALLSVRPVRMVQDAWLFNPLVSDVPRRHGVLQAVPCLAAQRPRRHDGEQMDRALRRGIPLSSRRRQRLRRGVAELRGAARVLPRLATGAARLVRLPLAPVPSDPVPEAS